MRGCTAVLVALLSILFVVATHAQAQTDGRYRIGYLSPETEITGRATFEAFRSGMGALGYVEGRNLTIDARWSGGSDERLERDAAEIAQARPAVIVAQTRAVFAARRTAGSIPVVFGFSGDPIVAKLAESLPHPGGNFTGITMMSLDLVGKRMELLKELMPGLRRVAVIANPGHAGVDAERRVSEDTARTLELSLTYFPVRNSAELEDALAEIPKKHCEAIVVFPDAGAMTYSARIAQFTAKTRIPAISGWVPFAEQGNLITYGPELRDAFRQLASYVDKILKGAKPESLPIQQPTKLELAVNAKTARAIGLTVSPTIMFRADRVIE